eukprot:TRINITY_DN95_c1_g1_i1.p1 TRINITY_DN95_c1_g1~~TRINITY_DN95_c1_g1_i1.p1  ORF type:complete len:335 (+),score=61.80 TRINITY_DN95_c1_g1_i1:41-1006(+)
MGFTFKAVRVKEFESIPAAKTGASKEWSVNTRSKVARGLDDVKRECVLADYEELVELAKQVQTRCEEEELKLKVLIEGFPSESGSDGSQEEGEAAKEVEVYEAAVRALSACCEDLEECLNEDSDAMDIDEICQCADRVVETLISVHDKISKFEQYDDDYQMYVPWLLHAVGDFEPTSVGPSLEKSCATVHTYENSRTPFIYIFHPEEGKPYDRPCYIGKSNNVHNRWRAHNIIDQLKEDGTHSYVTVFALDINDDPLEREDPAMIKKLILKCEWYMIRAHRHPDILNVHGKGDKTHTTKHPGDVEYNSDNGTYEVDNDDVE